MKGLKIPVGVDTTGSSATVEGDAYADQMIRTGLSDHDNANAFQQDTGLGAGMIFGMTDTSQKASILRRLYEMFAAWEEDRLFRLMRETIKWGKDSESGELTIEFKYINLESDETASFKKKFTTGA